MKENKTFDGSKIIKQVLTERKKSTIELAEMLGLNPQSIRNQLCRNSYKLDSFVNILEALDCHIEIVTNDTNKIFK